MYILLVKKQLLLTKVDANIYACLIHVLSVLIMPQDLPKINSQKWETDHRPRLDAWDKRSDLVLWEDLEGAGGEGGGSGDRDGEDMWTQDLFISMYDRIHYK